MEITTLIRKVNKAYKQDTGNPPAEDGHRWRYNAAAKQHGGSYVEIGDTYFYSSQAHPQHVADLFAHYAQVAGVLVKLEPVTCISYQMRSWPQDSWATQVFKVHVGTPCNTCGGNGRTICATCDGIGVGCPTCADTIFVQCPTCKGVGLVPEK